MFYYSGQPALLTNIQIFRFCVSSLLSDLDIDVSECHEGLLTGHSTSTYYKMICFLRLEWRVSLIDLMAIWTKENLMSFIKSYVVVDIKSEFYDKNKNKIKITKLVQM